jgi:hypothetical protein
VSCRQIYLDSARLHIKMSRVLTVAVNTRDAVREPVEIKRGGLVLRRLVPRRARQEVAAAPDYLTECCEGDHGARGKAADQGLGARSHDIIRERQAYTELGQWLQAY